MRTTRSWMMSRVYLFLLVAFSPKGLLDFTTPKKRARGRRLAGTTNLFRGSFLPSSFAPIH